MDENGSFEFEIHSINIAFIEEYAMGLLKFLEKGSVNEKRTD